MFKKRISVEQVEEGRELCVPIVTMGIGSLSERVEHGKTGFIAQNEKDFSNDRSCASF